MTQPMCIWTNIYMKNTSQFQSGHFWNPRTIRVKVIYRIQKAMLMEKNSNYLFYLKMIAVTFVVAKFTELK